MTRSTSRVRTLLATAAAAALLAACGETGIGVAARVGGEEISHEALAAVVDRGYVGPVLRRIERADMERVWLSQLVKARLYPIAAERVDAMPAPEELRRLIDDQLRAGGGQQAVEEQYAQNGVAASDLRPVLETAMLHELIGDALIRDVPTPDEQLRGEYTKQLARFDQAHIAHIRLKDKATADRVAAQARGGGDFAKLAEQSIDARTAANGGDLGVIGNGRGQFDEAIRLAVFKAKSGDILGPIKVADGFEIIRVVERVTLPFDKARDLIRRDLLKDLRKQRLDDYLTKVLRDIGVSVNPRYGRWDDKEFRVLVDDELSSPSSSPTVPVGP